MNNSTIRKSTLSLSPCLLVSLSVVCAFSVRAANVEPPPDPGYEVSVIAADVIADVEIIAGGPFRAVALVKKTLKGDAPKVIELEGYNSFNWDTVHHGLQAGARMILFLSKTERADVFVPLTPGAPRFSATTEGVMIAFGDPPVRIPVKAAALEQGLLLLIEKNKSGKVPQGAGGYLHGLWDLGEVEARYLAVEMAGALRDESALPILLEASKDKLLKLRLRAIEALGKVGTANALGALRTLLKDEKKTVARDAARVLAQMRDGESIPALLEWVRKNVASATNAGVAGGKTTDADLAKAEAVALDAIVLARSAGSFADSEKIARALLEIARLPNEKLAGDALEASMAVAPIDSVPALIELAEDRLYEQRERAFQALRRIALKPVRDIDEFKAWWTAAGKKYNEDARREAAEAAGRGLAHAEDYEERRKFLETLHNMPGGIAAMTCAPLLMNAKTSSNFGEDDLAVWNSPLNVPFLIERLGRDSATTRKNALDVLVYLCAKNPRLAAVCWPLIRAQLAERDSGIRRTAEAAVGALSQADSFEALLSAIAARGVYEPQDCGKFLYAITARTMGFSLNEPVPDQVVARRHFRGWWEGARKNFHALSISIPVNPFAIYPGDAAKIRVITGLDEAARAAKLEAQALLEDSEPSEAAFGLLMVERSADDGFWKKMMGQNRSRDRARGLLGSIGSIPLVPELSKRIGAKDDTETPLTRALILMSLAASSEAPDSNGAGAKAVTAWLKSSEVALNHPMKRLGVLCLGFANKEPDSLAFLNDLIDVGLKADVSDIDTIKVDDQNSALALQRAALIALCAREDGSAALIRLLSESGESRIREVAARELSLRRDRAAIPGIVRSLEKADRFTWMDFTYTLEPLLNSDDGAVLRELLDGVKNSTRLAAVWILSRRPELGNDPQTRAALIAALGDDSNLVRYYGAEALGKRKAKAALAALVKLLDDSDDDVRAAAAQAMGEIGDKDACELAGKAALHQFTVDKRWMKALAISGQAKWFADIMKLANSNLYPEKRAGLEALSASNSPDAKEVLLKAFRNDDEPQQTVAGDLLAERGDASLPLIAEDLASKDKAVRARALHLLTRFNSPKALAALKEALKTEDDLGIKALIEWAIGRAQN